MEIAAAAQKAASGALTKGSSNARSAYHPSQYKKRFCSSYPNVSQCRRGANCAFAHCREEVRVPLLSLEDEQQFPRAMSDDFFMSKYKTLWCPVGTQHDWLKCPYAHNYQDARRPVSIGYGAMLCPFWNKKQGGAEYSQRCPLGVRCPYAHGAKEQLYHPQYFKTATCRDIRGKRCPRSDLCAFFHKRAERRAGATDDVDYSRPLPEENVPKGWVADFLAQPFSAQEGGSSSASNAAAGAGVAGAGNVAAPEHPCYFPWLTPAAMLGASASTPGLEPNHERLAAKGLDMADMGTPAYIHMPPGLEKDSPRTQSTTSGEGDEEQGQLDAEAVQGDWFTAVGASAWPLPFDGCVGSPYESMLNFNSYAAFCAASGLQQEELWWNQAHDGLSWWDGASQ